MARTKIYCEILLSYRLKNHRLIIGKTPKTSSQIRIESSADPERIIHSRSAMLHILPSTISQRTVISVPPTVYLQPVFL
jgi:hypothetical protein